MIGEALWWQHGVVYQVYPRSFCDSDGDGIGDLDGVTARLEYLAGTLGVDAIWLSPFYRSPMRDFGYDIADHTDVDPLFGDLDAFDRMLAAAHRLGLRVIVDYVPNHTSDQHPWFLESRSSRSSPRRDWYLWRDPGSDGSPPNNFVGPGSTKHVPEPRQGPRPNNFVGPGSTKHVPEPRQGPRPNNWVSVWGGPAWEWDEATGQYYLHLFLPEMPDLNWRNPDVRAAMFDVVRFWMDRGVDGLRIDVAEAIMKHPDLPDNPPNRRKVRSYKQFGNWDDQLHLHDVAHPDIHDVYRELRRLLDGYGRDRPRVAIGEIHIPELDRWARYYGENLDELHLPFNFGLLTVRWRAAAVRRVVDRLEAALPAGAWPNFVLGNHDEPRIATRVGPQLARLAMLLLLTLRGTPTIYYGDELGMTDVDVPPERQVDPQGLRLSPDMSRDPTRSPMRWDATPGAGFTVPGVTPWLPFGDTPDVATQLDDPGSMLTLTRRLLALRRETPALSIGSYTPLEGPADCFLFARGHDGDRVVVALNFSAEPVPLQLEGSAALLISTDHERRAGHGAGDPLVLGPYEGCVLRPS